jgi:3,4-dihydroxy 2-butanone 4-phosphate synthase/GTP cyclohydrolase II
MSGVGNDEIRQERRGDAPGEAGRIEEAVLACLHATGRPRPVVTVTWAQSAAGAIAGPRGAPATLSGPSSLGLTHRLRSMHDAILVGIRTVISDDPLLSVRLAEGNQPQPVVLDTRLRFPLAARLLAREDRKPWIFHAGGTGGAAAALEARGAVLFAVPRAPGGVDLAQVLARLRLVGIGSVMVEGGAQVLRAFMAQGLAAQAVITVSPSRLEGLSGPGIPALGRTIVERLGDDTVTWGILAAS